MAFDLVAAGGYGSGELGDVTDPKTPINSVAYLDDWSGTSAEINVLAVGIDGGFKADGEVLFYIGSISDIDDGNEVYGKFIIASISKADGGTETGKATLYLNGDFEETYSKFPSMDEVRAADSFHQAFAISISV